MHIGILQTGHAPDALIAAHGDYDAMFERLLAGQGFSFATCAVCDGEMPAGTGEADGWLITGSRFGAYEDHAWIPPLEQFIREVRDAGRPMVGICFGHQIIAQALGGRVEKFDGGWSVGRVPYDFGGQTLHLNAWHQDQVTEAPAGAQIVATSPFCANAAMAYGDRILTIQPHPEFEPGFVDGLIRTRGRGTVPEPLLERAEAGLDRPLDTGRIAEMLAAVLKGGVHV